MISICLSICVAVCVSCSHIVIPFITTRHCYVNASDIYVGPCSRSPARAVPDSMLILLMSVRRVAAC